MASFRLGAVASVLVVTGCVEPPPVATAPRTPRVAVGADRWPGGSLQVAVNPVVPQVATFLRCDNAPSVQVGNTLFCFDEMRRTWKEAEEHCQQIGGHLAHLAGAQERQVLRAAFGKPMDLPPTAWIGLVEPFKEGEWGWMSGKRATFQHWNAGEPNDAGGEDCAELILSTGLWNDLDCATARPFLCEGAPLSGGAKSTFKCTGTFIQGGSVPYCLHTDNPLGVAAAEQFCKTTGGHLAELSTAEKDQDLFDALRPRAGDGTDFWIGLTDAQTEGDWRTASGEPALFNAWRPGEPNDAGATGEDCATMGSFDGAWNDVPCDGHTQSICRGMVDMAETPVVR